MSAVVKSVPPSDRTVPSHSPNKLALNSFFPPYRFRVEQYERMIGASVPLMIDGNEVGQVSAIELFPSGV